MEMQSFYQSTSTKSREDMGFLAAARMVVNYMLSTAGFSTFPFRLCPGWGCTCTAPTSIRESHGGPATVPQKLVLPELKCGLAALLRSPFSLDLWSRQKQHWVQATGNFWCVVMPTFYKEEMAKNKVGIFSLTSISRLERKKQQKMQ